ncbi:MAG: helix-turn-helix domain-containing protein [Chthoniobacterales bacterium]
MASPLAGNGFECGLRRSERLSDNERRRALARLEIIRPFLEDGVPLTRLARERQIVLRTARRWVERYRKDGLVGLVRRERNDKDERKL